MSNELKKEIFFPIINSNDMLDAVVAEHGAELIDLQGLKAAPRRIHEDIIFDDIRGFKSYLKDFETDSTILRIKKTQLLACFNYHKKDNPSWNEHTAQYNFKTHPLLQNWLAVEGKALSQEDFVKFLQLNYLSVASPTHSDLITYARELRIKTSNDTTSKVSNGETEISVNAKETVLTQNGKKISVIEDIVLAAPAYEGLPHIVKMNLKCFCGLEGNRVYFKLYFVDKEAVLEKLFSDIQNEFSTDYKKLKIYIG